MAPSIITGGAVLSLQKRGFAGNVFRGKSDILVIEADESDGSLINYHPKIAILLNLTKDHKELDVLTDYFRRFVKNCGKLIVNADDAALAEFYAQATSSYGFNSGDMRADNVAPGGFSSEFEIGGVKFSLRQPGFYNVKNALAAVAVCAEAGVSLEVCASALKNFGGVSRRFESAGSARGVEVIDDFAHNPAKISAALTAAQLRGKRVLSFYQPHGFAPVKLLKRELIDVFAACVRKGDIVWFTDIYYVGGMADKSVSSKELVDALTARGVDARYNPDKTLIANDIAACAQAGDVVMVMGARDPGLSAYARFVLTAIEPCPTEKTAAVR
jgi:UDP-N-acetylmuramate--alanine ligase